MGASIFDLATAPELRTLLEDKLRRQQFTGNRFAQWIGPTFVEKGGGTEEVYTHGPEGPGWTGAPIETVTAFIQKGRTDMLIPIRNRLTGRPTFGNKQLFGKGEAAAYGYRSVLINRSRKSYSPPTGMEEQKTRQYYASLIADADAQLSTWFNDYFPSAILASIFYGFSTDLIAPLDAGGRAVTPISHPNFFVAGVGEVGYSGGRPGTAGYEAAVEAAINGLAVSAIGGCSVQLIRNLIFEAPRKKIYPITTKSGFPFYPIWLKDSAWQQLQADPEYQALTKSLHIAELDKHPLGNGMVAYVAGAAIYTDFKLWCARTNQIDNTVKGGTVEYGPVPSAADRAEGFPFGDTMSSFDTGEIAMGILAGQSMLSVGTGMRINYTDEDFDHGNVKEVAVEFIESVVRNETYDTLGLIAQKVAGLAKGDFYENTGSLVFATRSPFALKYN